MGLRQGIGRAVVAGVTGLVLAVSLSGCDPTLWIICGVGACDEGVDYFPPETPQDVKATPFSKGVEIAWRRNPDPRVRFQVLRTTDPGRDYVPITQTPDATYEDRGTTLLEAQTFDTTPTQLENGTTYYYVVKAVNVDSSGDVVDEGIPSEEVSATPQANIPPRPPEGVTAAGGSNFIDLAWGRSFTAAKYHVYRAIGDGEFTRLVDRGPGELAYRDVGLAPGTYRYAITAENADGAESERSTIVSASPTGSGFGWLASFAVTAPWDVSTDAQGRIYVVNTGGKVSEFDNSRTFVRSFGEAGDICFGNVGTAGGIATDAAGNSYVSDIERNCVHKFNANGTTTGGFGGPGTAQGQFDEPRDVAVDATGNVYVVDRGNNRVQKFSPAGAFMMAFGQAGDGPGEFNQANSIAVARSGDIYVSEPDRIQRFDSAGQFKSQWDSSISGSESGYVTSLAVSPGGDVYVPKGNIEHVLRFNAGGEFLDKFGSRGADPGEFMNPTGIAVDCAGKVYVVDNNNQRVQKFGDPNTADPPCSGSTSPTGPGLARAQRFEARFSASGGKVGRMAQHNNKLNETGATQRGAFSIKALGRKTALGRRLAKLFGRGKWSALYDVAGDPLKRKGTATGTLVATSSKKSGGKLCLSFKVNLKIVRKKLDIRGTFRTLGGTRGAATLNARGSYRQTRRGRKGWTIRGTTTAAKGKRKSLPARCRAVKP